MKEEKWNNNAALRDSESEAAKKLVIIVNRASIIELRSEQGAEEWKLLLEEQWVARRRRIPIKWM